MSTEAPIKHLPDEKILEYRIDALKAAASAVQNASILMLTILAYLSLTAISATDGSVLVNGGTMELPLIRALVSPVAFYLAGSVIGYCLLLFLTIRVQTVRRLASKLTDGLSIGGISSADIMNPWVQSLVQSDPGSFSLRRAELWVPWAAITGALPITFLVIGWRISASTSEIPLACLSVLIGIALLTVRLLRSRIGTRWDLGFVVAAVTLIVLVHGRRLAWELLGPYWPDGLQFADLTNAPLANRNFQKTNLYRAVLTRAQLRNSDISDSYLHEVVAADADFRFSNGKHAWMPWAVLDRANLNNAVLSYATLNDASLVRAKAVKTNLRGARLQNADATGADLSGADLRSVVGHWAKFEDARIDNAKLSFASFWGARFQGALAWDMRVDSADLRETHFDRANIERGRFVRVWFGKSTFVSAVASYTWFLDVDLRGADFERATLWQSHFCGVALAGASLKDANVSSSEFRNTNLEGANVRGANLYAATLENVDLGATDLRGTNLTSVRMVNRVKFGAKADKAALSVSDLLSDACISMADFSKAQNLTNRDLCRTRGTPFLGPEPGFARDNCPSLPEPRAPTEPSKYPDCP